MKMNRKALLCGMALMALACSKSESESTINVTTPTWRDVKPPVVVTKTVTVEKDVPGPTVTTVVTGPPGAPGATGAPGEDGDDGKDGKDGKPGKVVVIKPPKHKECDGYHFGKGNDHRDCGKR